MFKVTKSVMIDEVVLTHPIIISLIKERAFSRTINTLLKAYIVLEKRKK